MVWTFPDPIPLHREPLYTPRRDLVAKYPTYTDRKAWRLPTLYASIQKNDHSKQFPTILTSGRLVEYEGGGDESRSNKWLAELQQEMFCEINPADAGKLGVKDGAKVWVHSPEGGKVLVAALVTERVAAGVAFMPFHFGGYWQGKDLRGEISEGQRSIRARRSVEHGSAPTATIRSRRCRKPKSPCAASRRRKAPVREN